MNRSRPGDGRRIVRGTEIETAESGKRRDDIRCAGITDPQRINGVYIFWPEQSIPRAGPYGASGHSGSGRRLRGRSREFLPDGADCAESSRN